MTSNRLTIQKSFFQSNTHLSLRHRHKPPVPKIEPAEKSQQDFDRLLQSFLD